MWELIIFILSIEVVAYVVVFGSFHYWEYRKREDDFDNTENTGSENKN